jgi:D-arabinose 1-dehydrogenase-like Zn-dependent alcohol dehydrogenase
MIRRQALMTYGGSLQAIETPVPQLKDGEVLLKVSHCGLCHSDLHLIEGHFDLGEGRKLDIRDGRQLPFTPGHEICGTIEAHGPSVMGIAKDEKLYAVYPWIGCGKCWRCERGEEHLCDEMNHIGIHRDGGFASHVVVPHPRYLIDAEGIDPEIAGTYMCSGLTAYSALRKALADANEGPLLIMGFGGVGFMALELAQSLSNRDVVVADVEETKRRTATARGAVLALDPSEEVSRRTLKTQMGRMAAAIDFVGSSSSLDFAQSVLGRGGSVVVVGLMGGRIGLAVPMFPLRQLSIVGSFVGSLAEAKALIGLVRQKSIRPVPVTVKPLAAANEAIAALREGRVLGRMVLRPWSGN